MYQIKVAGTNNMIYDQSQMGNLSVVGPKASYELNEAGNLTFTLTKRHPLIDSLEPIATYISALDDGEEIFYGRLLQRSDPTTTGNVNFTCEGALSFLLDSEIAPYGKDRNKNQITRTMTAEQFFRACIEEHNAEVNDSRRQFTVGIVNADKRAVSATYSITNFTQTKSALEAQLLSVYGGFIRARRVNNVLYIDWIQNYENVDAQDITIGENVIDQNNELDGSSLFTVLRPVGKDGITLTEKTIDIYSQADMNKYGRIVKSIEFNGATTESELRTQANDYVSRIQKTLFVTSSISLVDMHYIDGTSPKIRLGNRFTQIHGLEGMEMVASSLDLDFEKPQNDKVDLKNRKSLDPDLTPEGNKHSTKSFSKGSRKSQGQYFKYLRETGEQLEVLAPQVFMHGQQLTQYYERIQRQSSYIESISSRAMKYDEVLDTQNKRINNLDTNVRSILGSAVIQNSQQITNIVGNFEIWEDQNHHVTVHLKDGAEFTVDDENGSQINVGNSVNLIASQVRGLNQTVNSIQGSALWNQENQLVGIAGSFDIQETVVPDPDPNHEGQYITKKKLIVKDGSGFQIREDGVEYGVYMTPDTYYHETHPQEGDNPKSHGWYEKRGDNYYLTNDETVQSGKTYYRRDGQSAVLTGGLMVEKINGQVTTKIRGDIVDIQARNVNITATATLDSVVGHFEEEEYQLEDGSHHPIIDPTTGEPMTGKRLVYKADGGMRVRRLDDNGVEAEYGTYDDGNLTGGVIVTLVNGQTTTQIKGSRVIIGDLDGDEDLANWAEYVAGENGLIAAKASIRQLNAVSGRIDNLTGGTVIENYVGASLVTGTTVTANGAFNFRDGSNSDLKNGHWRALKMPNETGATALANATAIAYVLGEGAATAINLWHSHSMSVDNSTGIITIGGPLTDSTGNFNIADTAFHQNAVLAVTVSSITGTELITLTQATDVSITASPSNGNTNGRRTASIKLVEHSVALTGFNSAQDCVEVKLDDVVIGRIRPATAIANANAAGVSSVSVSTVAGTELITQDQRSTTTITATASNNATKTAEIKLVEHSVALTGFNSAQDCVEVKIDNVVIGRIRPATAISNANSAGVDSVTVDTIAGTELTTLTQLATTTITATASNNATKTAEIKLVEHSVALTGFSSAQDCVEVKLDDVVIGRIRPATAIANANAAGVSSVSVSTVAGTELTSLTQLASTSITATASNNATKSAGITLVEHSVALSGYSSSQDCVEVKLDGVVIGRIRPSTAITNAYNSGYTAGANSVTHTVTIGAIQFDSGDTAVTDQTSRMLYCTAHCGDDSDTSSLWLGIIQDGNKMYVRKTGWSGPKMLVETISGYHPTPKYYCANNLTKHGVYPTLYAPDTSGIILSIKVKNISSANRCWYSRDGAMDLDTYYK